MKSFSIISGQKQSPVVIKKKNNCAKVAKTVARKFFKGILLPVGTLAGGAVGAVQGASTGFLAGYFSICDVVGYEGYDLRVRFLPETNPHPGLIVPWVLCNGGFALLGTVGAIKGICFAAPVLGELGYNATNSTIDFVFGKHKSTASKQNTNSLNNSVSQNVESKSQKNTKEK